MVLRFLTTIIVSLCAVAAHAATDVNKASRAELEAIPGVGPALSGKILEARRSGEFRNWDDLVERVSGIGPGSAARLSKAGLTVGGAAYSGGDKPAAQGSRAPKAEGTARPANGSTTAAAGTK
jgi:competence protein ComEA